MKRVYAVLSLIGFIIPYVFFIQFLRLYGLDSGEFPRQMFASPIAAFFTDDVVISSLVFWV